MNDITIWIVFMAGLASFVSPCFLPLIPIYVGYMSGEALGSRKRWSVVKNSLGFVIGFTAVFVILGATASGLGHFLLLYRNALTKVLGIIVIIMGLFYMDLIKIKAFNMEKRFNYEGKKSSFFGAMLLGSALAFGWTPCIGPILAAVLSIAASKNSFIYGMYLLFVYSMGIALPFLITATLIQGAASKLRGIMKYTRIIKIVTGLVLIITGIWIYTGYLVKLSGILYR
jgi:cytochrome c-type biogenesis protein